MDSKKALSERFLRIAKAQVSSTITRRHDSWALAQRLAPAVHAGRAALRPTGQDKSDRALSIWLNKNGFLKPNRKGWKSGTLRDQILEADDRQIEHLVLECRTRMTCHALSADFNKTLELVHELEREYLELIADALEFGHVIRHEAVRSRHQLLEEARMKAVSVAAEQRRTQGMTMMARERLWQHYEKAPRKVFEPRE